MSNVFDLDGPVATPAAGGPAQQLIVLLHGYGADGNDLIDLAPHWAGLLPHAAFVSPHAPFPCEASPQGRQWFGFEGRDNAAIYAGVLAAASILDHFLDQALERFALPASRMALVGFSQGTMMALHVALRREVAVGGILGYSGRLIAPPQLADEIRSKPPVLLVHGDADPVVPFAALAEAASALTALGVSVTTERRPGLPHAIDPTGLAKGGEFLARNLSQAQPAAAKS
jgi:phospholipase/carboxylesterase